MTIAAAGPGRASTKAVLVPVCLAVFITALDNTVVNVALPSMQRDLHLSATGIEWVATSYILTFSSLLLAGGRLTDLYGRRDVLLTGLAVFVGFSLLAGLAPTGGVLIGARVCQGAGAALILPATLAILAADTADKDRELGAGAWAAAIAAALALGPLVGGLLSQYWNWSWIFYLNAPVGAVVVVLTRRVIPPDAIGRTGRPLLAEIDLPGLATSTVAFFAVTYALVQGHDRGFGSPVILLALVVTLLASAGFVLVEQSAPEPMVDMALFRDRIFWGGTLGQVLWGLGVNGVFFFTSLYLQNVLGFSPTEAGLAFVPMALALIAVVPFAPRLVTAIGVHRTVCVGMVGVAVGMVMASFVGEGASFASLLPCLLVLGVSSGLITPLTAAVLEVVPPARAGMASAVVSIAREVSGVFGIAVVGVIVMTKQSAALRNGASATHAFVSGYSTGLRIAAVLVLIGAVVSVVTLRPAVAAARRARHAATAGGRHRRLTAPAGR